MKPLLMLAAELATRKTTSQALIVVQSGEDRRLLAVGLALESALRQ